ncbi:carbamoyltransferase HypF [Desulfotalea psychrophila]|uniref:Carbamoyltransferase n=1 Tax=Desulfotalea psychrophila (strain LSv54 / DSM 12343) TaxID=177439 RepID=Q6AQR7_DESPS|nr:carbamoyltransferase HypF [Desulfotalea psychrophila]CAG35306.1 probable hydrogenase accessory protein HypF [Desulfotalea psychrophila LSv54]
MKGVEIFIRGTVQGVGFRPFIYNLARQHGLSGTVCNTGDGVAIHTSCSKEELEAFIGAVRSKAPPLSRIQSIEHGPKEIEIEDGRFTISKSSGTSSADASIPPDIALCADCLSEMQDPNDPRFAYPFINCTNCGPRFTIVEKIPYDRQQTSMKVFPMCEACTRDYEDPGNRRFHAQPNACPLCGPQVSWHDQAGNKIETKSPLTDTAVALAANKLVAIRGLGGFHLSCNALEEKAVAQLRERKRRPHKPLAIMVQSIDIAKKYCFISEQEIALLSSIEHPIVLLQKRPDTDLAQGLAPHITELGIMLAYTPLHHLLFQESTCPQALVMTSGNSSGTPICTGNAEAIDRLGPIVDNFLLHNRDIVTRIDDSVTRVSGKKPLILRRARGYVPSPIHCKWTLPATIGCGGGLKSTFCLGKKNSLFTSQHIGDLSNLESYDFFQESIEHLKKVFDIEPEIAVCDLHPDYLSTHYAKALGIPLYQVQHHHAHATAVMAEHGLKDPVIAIILDGTGYGDDGTSWGGEILQADLTSFTRLAHLSHLRLPGGDKAATEPWRMGISALHSLYGDGLSDKNIPTALRQIERDKREPLLSMLNNNFNSPLTSSCGRLFDTVSSLLGICQKMSYEGQAAMELEDRARRCLNSTWKNDLISEDYDQFPFLLDDRGITWEINSLQLIKTVLDDIQMGKKTPEIALRFHLLLIKNITALTLQLCTQTGLNQVVLSGGCMQNAIILEGLRHTMATHNISVFTGENIPINDGGISLGQTITGGLQHVSRNSHEGNQGRG